MAKFFAVTSKGFESVLYSELSEMGTPRVKQSHMGVTFEGPWKKAYEVVHRAKSATRVIKPILDFSAYNKQDIYSHIKKHDFTKYIPADGTLRVDTQGRSKIFKDSRTVSLITKDAIVDQFREKYSVRPSVEKKNPDLPILIKVSDEKISVSLDLVGRSLSHRGYREQSTDAPIREHIAAGLLLAAEWDPNQEVLMDPMCGSGTFVIEGARMCQNKLTHPLSADFAYKKWKTFNAEDVSSLTDGAPLIAKPDHRFFGYDQSQQAIQAAKVNAAKARIDFIQWKTKSCLKIMPPTETGLIITNPPYGVRLNETEKLIPFFDY